LYGSSPIGENPPVLQSHKHRTFISLHGGRPIALQPPQVLFDGKIQMLRIQRTGKVQVVFRLSGRLDSETANELRHTLELEKDGCRLALDLRDLTLVNRDAVTFLERCEASNVKLRNCPPYVREWITRERETAKGQEGMTRNSQSQEGPL
jgi:hypothetical protein